MKFQRYMAVPELGDPIYFRFRWMARLVAWFTGWTFIDTNEQGTTATIDQSAPTGCSPILIALVVLALGALAWAVV